MHDLVVRGGHVIDPANGVDAVLDVAFSGGRVAFIGPDAGRAREIRDVTGLLVVPGLIDMHTHVYWGGTSMGVDAEAYSRRCGATTLVDAGSAGAGNIAGFRAHVIERSEVRIRPFLNLAFPGIYAFSPNVNVGEAGDPRLLHQSDCVAAARAHGDLVVGIKIRLGGVASGSQGLAPLEMAIEVGDRTGLPVMAHVDIAPPSYADVVSRLRPGDILTHCFRPFPNAPLASETIRAEVTAARDRGVFFDLGHGRSSFGFETAASMMERGFRPDVLSSDIHVLSDNGEHDLLSVMSRFLALSLSLEETIAAATINPARILRLDAGTLSQGVCGDATILELIDRPVEYRDWTGATLRGMQSLRCRGSVLGGRWRTGP